MLSPGRVVQKLVSYRCNPITPPLIRLGNNRLVECRLYGHAVLRVLNLCLVETLMLHIQVSVCLTYRLHVSMPVAQGSSRVRTTAVRLQQKETPVCLCSCTPCEGIHAQVTSQRGGGARAGPGNLNNLNSFKSGNRPPYLNYVNSRGSPWDPPSARI